MEKKALQKEDTTIKCIINLTTGQRKYLEKKRGLALKRIEYSEENDLNQTQRAINSYFEKCVSDFRDDSLEDSQGTGK